ncbi:anaerobic ribonucleoside-triphosphate reductase [Acetomicrobium mobile]|uniref:anaerobic ribonucleoside-triphosphate reductase n=1 Tax=Acetomicrobium mobile TaxID=97477 RepID=UPI0026F036AB|nr:anaerobic ribonucleoside-triphosphate reductase [Acetomicrobium mobile]
MVIRPYCSDRDLRQLAQMLIFEFNQLAGGRGGQVAFTDINLYYEIPKHFRHVQAIGPGGKLSGKTYGDYSAIAMDVKAPWEKYDLLCGCTVDTNLVQRSLFLLLHLGLEVEIRTTFVPDLMNYDDLAIIQSYLVENVRWAIQCFRPQNAMSESLRRTKEPEREVLREKFPGAIIR